MYHGVLHVGTNIGLHQYFRLVQISETLVKYFGQEQSEHVTLNSMYLRVPSSPLQGADLPLPPCF